MKKNTLLLFLCIGISYVNAQGGSNDATFNTADVGYGNYADGAILHVLFQPDGKILIIGAFTHYKGNSMKYIARINPDESIDTSFNIGTGPDNTISDIQLQADGKILVAGAFNSFNGVSCGKLVRLNANGSIDNTFNANVGTNGSVYNVVVQPDGKIIAGGNFTVFGANNNANRIIRLSASGSVDTSFNTGTGANSAITKLRLQPDGKIICSGSFTSFNALPETGIVRLNTTGSIDAGFSAGTDGTVSDLLLLPDGKIMICGDFVHVNGSSAKYAARLMNNGVLDTSFNSPWSDDGFLRSVSLQSTGKLIFGRVISDYNTGNIVRTFADGTIDSSFNAGQFNDHCAVVDTEVNGQNKIIAVGLIGSYDGIGKSNLVQLDADGFNAYNAPDFGTGADDTILSGDVFPDGKLIIGGYFTHFNGVAAKIVKLSQDGSIDANFSAQGLPQGNINKIKLQADGKVLVSIPYENPGAQIYLASHLIRLNADGTTDTGFTIPTSLLPAKINDITVQQDGKILLAGFFTIGDTNISYVRLNSDGSLDTTFAYGMLGIAEANRIAVQDDNKILVCSLGGVFKRFNNDGSPDTSFNALYSQTGSVWDFVVLASGKILVGGSIYPANKLVLLNADGSVDNSFISPVLSGAALHIAAFENGKFALAGNSDFSSYNGTPINKLVVINADGSIDSSFTGQFPTDNGSNIDDLLVQPGNKLLIYGEFTQYGGAGRNRIARINTQPLGVLLPEGNQGELIAFSQSNVLTVAATKDIQNIEVFDITGRKIAQHILNDRVFIFRDMAPRHQLLIIKATMSDGSILNKKVIF